MLQMCLTPKFYYNTSSTFQLYLETSYPHSKNIDFVIDDVS